MHIEIRRNAEIPLAKQIYYSIVDRIRSGLLQEGAQLPTVRGLSKQLGVSLVTVVKAYRDLEREGFITSTQGKGTFVQSKRRNGADPEPQPFDWQLSVPDYLPRSQFSRLLRQPSERIQLSTSMVDPDLLPHRFLGTVMQRIVAEAPAVLGQYAEVQGDLQLRKALAAYMNGIGVSAAPEELLITNGSQQGLDLIARTFVGPGDVVVMEAPTYPGAIDVFRGRGATILSVPVDAQGMRADILHHLCDKYKPKLIYTVPTFHNPTGTVMTPTRRKQMLELAQSVQCLIVEDDPWSEIFFDRKPPAPIKSMDRNGHVIYVKGFSKTVAPSCRIGMLAASGTVFNRLLAAKANADLGSPLITQKLLLPFVGSKKMVDHVTSLRTALRRRRDIALEALTSGAPNGMSWIVPEGGLNVWIQLPARLDANRLLFEAKKQGLSFLPGSACYPVEPDNRCLRVSFSYAPEPLLREGLTALCGIVEAEIASLSTAGDSLHF